MLITLVVASACGRSATSPTLNTPSSPSAPVPALADGAFDIQFVSGMCNDFQVAGTSVAVLLTATHDADGTWVAHPSSAAGGNFEIRLKVGGNATSPNSHDVAVTGTWSGTAIDSYKSFPNYALSDASVILGDSATFTGLVHHPFVTFADGSSSTSVTFTRNGASSTCPAGTVAWHLDGPLISSADAGRR
jgi:hypothetical protein